VENLKGHERFFDPDIAPELCSRVALRIQAPQRPVQLGPDDARPVASVGAASPIAAAPVDYREGDRIPGNFLAEGLVTVLAAVSSYKRSIACTVTRL
jgi:hypothetical protein